MKESNLNKRLEKLIHAMKHDRVLCHIVSDFVLFPLTIILVAAFGIVFVVIQSLPSWLGLIALALVILYILGMIGSRLMDRFIGDDEDD